MEEDDDSKSAVGDEGTKKKDGDDEAALGRGSYKIYKTFSFPFIF